MENDHIYLFHAQHYVFLYKNTLQEWLRKQNIFTQILVSVWEK